MSRTTADERQADVIVVGAGPAGSSTAYHLANAGVDVLLLEKSAFPRDKICGDGLTPRATKQLIGMGFDLDEPGWQRNLGLRIVGAGHRLELPWPELTTFPPFGAVRTLRAQVAGDALAGRTSFVGTTAPVTGRRIAATAPPG